MQKTSTENNTWLEKSLSSSFKFNLETLIFTIIILFAIFSRLYQLGERVMSHDEINHVYFAWNSFQGSDYIHHPLSHGPFQFHLLIFFYYLFGDTDFSARLHAAVFSIGTIVFLWNCRKYLGRTGTLITAGLFVISPFMLFYGRYARNEALVAFFVLITAWAMLRYLDTGKNRFLYILAGASAFHFTTKETSFIFTAQLLLFLGILFIYRISYRTWKIRKLRTIFLILLILTFIIIGTVVLIHFADAPIPSELDTTEEESSSISMPLIIGAGAAGLVFVVAFVILIVGFGWKNLRQERAFGILFLLFTLIFPHLSAFPMFWAKWPIFEYNTQESVIRILAVLVPMFLVSIIAGILWKPREWLISAGVFYGIFIFFYSSVFTNMDGIYTGIVGSLGYWLEQQAVERGSQPWYYYILVLIPMYEYIAALCTLLVAGYGIIWLFRKPSKALKASEILIETQPDGELPDKAGQIHLVSFGLFWTVTGVLAYMVAGEKMPWLTVHIVVPMLLLSGWWLGKLIDSIDWRSFIGNRKWLTVILLLILVPGFGEVIRISSSTIQPFQGTDLPQLQTTGNFVISASIVLICLGGIFYQLISWTFREFVKTVVLVIFAFLGMLTIRASIMASYINYNRGKEYLVYAHGAQGPKEIFTEVEEIAVRISGGRELMVAYDNHSAYPFWWYFRHYPNQLQYGETPTRDLRDYPVILVGDSNYGKLAPIVGDAYIETEFVRMVWPNQDYFNLDYYSDYLKNPETRGVMLNAFWQIWLNHDFEPYAAVTGQDMSDQNWNPSNKMRMYLRKDVVAQIWEFGVSFSEAEIPTDPYEKTLDILPSITIADVGLNQPRGIAVANDGTLYLADSANHRVLHFSQAGEKLHEWGAGGDFTSQTGMALGFFNQPWGLVTDEDGYVYVADTWNHRIQKFTSEGNFITSWGYFNNQLLDPYGMWGPRDIVIDQNAYLLVSDTGNKRITIFDGDGQFIGQIGEGGFLSGQLDEAVGLAISPSTGDLFVADTWNQRVQRFEHIGPGQYTSTLTWDIDAWYGQSLDNKPYIAVDQYDRVYVADPEGAQVLVFSSNGEFLGKIGDTIAGFDGFGLVSGLTVDEQGGLWVSDGGKNRLQYFIMPEP
ncbi:MAG: TIGR03663 family protein [Anaerolineales bacterium]